MIEIGQSDDRRFVAALLLACREQDVEQELEQNCGGVSIDQFLSCARVVCAHIEASSMIDNWRPELKNGNRVSR